jgi:hypothetical protein
MMSDTDDLAADTEAEFPRRAGKPLDEATMAEVQDVILDLAEGDDEAKPKAQAPGEPAKVRVEINPAEWHGKLKALGGSQSDLFNNWLGDQVAKSLWAAQSTPQQYHDQCNATMAAMIGIGPRDELEGMLVGQMIACHAASMECFRRAMLPDQTTDGRASNLSMANKSSRTFAALLEALARARGKTSTQKMTIEHVHIHAGAQTAIIGAVETGGGRGDGGHGRENGKQPHAPYLAHATELPLWGADPKGGAMPIPSDDERSVPDARRSIDRRADRKPPCLEARPYDGPSEGRAAALRRADPGDATDDQVG